MRDFRSGIGGWGLICSGWNNTVEQIIGNFPALNRTCRNQLISIIMILEFKNTKKKYISKSICVYNTN